MKKIFKYCFMLFIFVGSLYAQENKQHTGIILDTMDSGGYTYMKIDENKNVYWIAVGQTSVKKGETYKFKEQTWMTNFKSSSLNRTFDKILFASPMSEYENLTWSEVLKPKTKSVEKVNIQLSTNVVAAKTGTVAFIVSKQNELKNKSILVNGEVVKVLRGIMKTSWIHVQDSNGDKLIFRAAKEDVNVGDKVEATGILNVDVDYGYGYTYKTIVVNSTFKKI